MNSDSEDSETDNDANSDDSDEEIVAEDPRWQSCNSLDSTIYNFDDANSGISNDLKQKMKLRSTITLLSILIPILWKKL